QAPEPEVVVDRGETFVRIGLTQGLTKGVTLDVLSADRRQVLGSAVVMEVWDSLARVNLDSASSAYKGQRLARVRGAAPSGSAAPAPAPSGASAAPVAAMPPPPPPAPSGRTTLGSGSPPPPP